MAKSQFIAIQNPTEAQSASGAITTTWNTFAERSAWIETAGGREFYRAQQINAELTHLVKCGGFAAVTTKMRVAVSGGRVFEILAAWSADGKALANAPEIHLACREML
jgi:SPP1 family predicted phage head-tail adaptor